VVWSMLIIVSFYFISSSWFVGRGCLLGSIRRTRPRRVGSNNVPSLLMHDLEHHGIVEAAAAATDEPFKEPNFVMITVVRIVDRT
jgi:hypothetical protein